VLLSRRRAPLTPPYEGSEQAMANLRMGDKAINFSLLGTDGMRHSLDDYRGKAVAVIFSCNHCPYVRAWEDRMVKIQSDYGEKGIQLIAINANDATKYPDDSFAKMKERAREKSFNFPYLHDESQEIARAYGAERTPEVFLFDENATLHYHGAIDDNYDDPAAVKAQYLRDALDAMLERKAPRIMETKPVGCTIKWK
jgi:peroxiredoxin